MSEVPNIIAYPILGAMLLTAGLFIVHGMPDKAATVPVDAQATTPPRPAPQIETEWYFAHAGSETCVPIGDIDIKTGQRSYYQGGDMLTRQQMKQKLEDELAGYAYLEEVPTAYPDKTIDFRVTNTDGTKWEFGLFNDQAFCKSVMTRVAR